MGLEGYRKRINEIDNNLLKLLNERVELALKIGAEKQQQGLPVYVPERENEILDRLVKLNHGPLMDEGVRNFFTDIIKVCREMQKRQQTGLLNNGGKS